MSGRPRRRRPAPRRAAPRSTAGVLGSVLETVQAVVVGGIVLVGAIRDRIVVAAGKLLGV